MRVNELVCPFGSLSGSVGRLFLDLLETFTGSTQSGFHFGSQFASPLAPFRCSPVKQALSLIDCIGKFISEPGPMLLGMRQRCDAGTAH